MHAMPQTSQFIRIGHPVRLAALGLALVGLIGTAGIASAQTQPTAPSSAPQTHSPFWGDSPARFDGYGREKDGDGFSDKFPVGLAAVVAPAHERYTALKWTYRTARSQPWHRLEELRREFENSSEYRQFIQDREAALARLEQARQQALEPLQSDPEYLAAGRLRRDLEGQIQRAHDEENPDMGRIRAMSELALNYGRLQKELERTLTEDDEAIRAARQELRELGRRQGELEEQFDQQVRDDEQLAQLREQVDQLRIGYLAAGAYYDSAVRTANIAADFAYYNAYTQSPYYRRFADPYYGGYTSPYGYGWGYQIPSVAPFGLFTVGPIRVKTPTISRPIPAITNVGRGPGVSNVHKPAVSNVGPGISNVGNAGGVDR